MSAQPQKQPVLDTSLKEVRPRTFYGLSLPRYLFWLFVWTLFFFLDIVFLRVRARGLENFPKDGPLFLFSNHTSTLDPFWAGWAVQRPLFYMAATSVLRIPFFGPMLGWLGAYPKKKYVKDRASMKKTVELIKDGQAVVIYPEGLRTWNGETQAIRPGVGRLVKRYDVPVMYARLESAYFAHPRWAKWPRWVPVQITFEGPYRYGEGWTPEEIDEDCQRRINNIPALHGTPATWSYRRAEGLPNYLWACPSCHHEESLQVDEATGNEVRCGHCGASWELDIRNQLVCKTTGSKTTLADAWRGIRDAIGAPPVPDTTRFESRGVVLEAPDATVRQIGPDRKEPETVATGTLQLCADRLQVVNGAGSMLWSTPLADLQAVSVEVAAQLYIRYDDALFVLLLGEQSTCKWGAIVRAWQANAQGLEGDAIALGMP